MAGYATMASKRLSLAAHQGWGDPLAIKFWNRNETAVDSTRFTKESVLNCGLAEVVQDQGNAACCCPREGRDPRSSSFLSTPHESHVSRACVRCAAAVGAGWHHCSRLFKARAACHNSQPLSSCKQMSKTARRDTRPWKGQ